MPKSKAGSKTPADSDASPANRYPVLHESGHDLASLRAALLAPDKKLSHLFFRNVKEETLVEEGTQVDSRNIVDDMPRFVASALGILAELDDKRRSLVRLPPGIFALIVHEASALDAMKTEHDTGITAAAGDVVARETTLRRELREGMALRDLAVGALGHALSEDQMEKVDRIVGDASTADSLARGMKAVARFIEGVLEHGSDDDKAALEAWGVGSASADELTEKARTIRDAGKVTAMPGRRISQRGLDLQDGRVLLLVDVILRAFKLARRTERSILLPELNKIAWMFETRARPAKGDAAKGDAAKSESAKGEAAKGEAAKGDAAKGEVAKGDVAKSDAGKGDAAKADAAKGAGKKSAPAEEAGSAAPRVEETNHQADA